MAIADWKGRKYRPPAIPSPHIRRDNVLSRLAEGQNHLKRLTIVQGGSGYGKSTVVADYVSQSQRPFVWLSLDAGDTDFIAFFTHLLEAVAYRFPGFGTRTLELLRSTMRPQEALNTLVGLFADELLAIAEPAGLMIVIDDFHEVEAVAAIQTTLELLIQYLPDAIQLIVVTRYPLPLKLAQWRVRQQLVELTTESLRFSAEEISQLLASFETLPFSTDQIGIVAQRTEGWVASLVLIGYALQMSGGHPFEHLLGEASDAIYDYLAQEVFAAQPPDIQPFLLQASILPHLDPDLCDLVLERHDSHEIMRQLLKKPVFLSRVSQEDERVYQFHPLYQLFLQDQLRQQLPRTQWQRLYHRLGDVLAERAPEQALKAYLLADAPQAAEQQLQLIADVYMPLNRWETLLGLLELFSAGDRDQSAWWHIYRGEVARWVGDYDRALQAYQAARAIAERQANFAALGAAYAYEGALVGSRGDSRQEGLLLKALDYLPETDRGRAFALNALALARLMANDSEQAIAYHEEALALYRQVGDAVGQSKVLHNLGLVYTRFGWFEQAAAMYRESIRQAEAAGKFGHAMTYNNLAILAIYQGDFQAAWEPIERALAIAQTLRSRREEVFALITLGWLNVTVGEFRRAQDELNRACALAIALGDRPSEASALDGLAEVARLQGKLPRAVELIEQAVALRGLPLDHPVMTDLALSLAMITLEAGQLERAEPLLQQLYITYAERQYRYRLCRVCFGLARLYHAKQQDELQHDYQRQALHLAEANNYHYLAAHEQNLLVVNQAERSTLVVSPILPAAIEIRCLGAFEVIVEGRLIPTRDWRGYKTKMILAYLLQHRSGVSKEQLTEILYGDQETSRTAVLVLISRLRQALEPDLDKAVDSRFIHLRDGRYYFNWAVPYQLDVETFQDLIQRAEEPEHDRPQQMALWRQAIDLYRGDYLAEFTSEAWCQVEQAYYRRLAQDTYSQLLDYLLDDEHYPEALDLSDRFLSFDPLSEKAYQAKIEAFAHLGRREEAMRHYQHIKTLLAQQFGLPLSPETEQLRQRLLR